MYEQLQYQLFKGLALNIIGINESILIQLRPLELEPIFLDNDA
jgi:hypothetical protein